MARSGSGRLRAAAAGVLLSLALLAAGCGGNAETDDGKLSVVASFYPLYYLAAEIGGERIEAVNLVAAGVEPHDWTPKSRDLARVSAADLFLYNGAGFEGWTDEFLAGIQADSSVKVVEASAGIELIPARPAAAAGLHDGEDEHEHGQDDHGHGHEHDHRRDGVYDPHTWVSPKSMLRMAETVKDALAGIDPANAAAYEDNYETLAARLTALDEAFERELSVLPRRDIVVSHQAFGYLCRDYGLNQIAVMGLSPEAEPRAQDLKRIVQWMREHDIRYVFFEELVSDQLARVLADEAGTETLVLNPVEGLTPEQEANGDNYVTIMEMNLQNLRKALQ